MQKTKQAYYQAVLAKDRHYDGLFYLGVTTTGIFCLPSCPARKPKFENCEFFKTAQDALLASFRPCKRCHPLANPHQPSKLLEKLVSAVEAEPEKRWKDSDFKALGLDRSTARRQFKKRFGMTFVAYARARRMGLAMQAIRKGGSVIDTQLASGYESGSGFRDAFAKIMGVPPKFAKTGVMVKARWLDTPVGPMLAIADDEGLYLLEFLGRRGLEREIERLRTKLQAAIIPGSTQPIEQIQQELELYFSGKLQQFKTPLKRLGSPFQKTVWQALERIPFGETCSYAELATAIGKPTACRAVANANGANQLAIVIPCHRVINTGGKLGGYGGGIDRKIWLLEHEKKVHI